MILYRHEIGIIVAFPKSPLKIHRPLPRPKARSRRSRPTNVCEVIDLANDTSAIDAATIAALREEDDSLLRELRDLFAAETAEQLPRMRQAYGEGDAKTVAMGAHRLKGSAVTFGAGEMQRRCLEIETLAKAGAMRDVERLIDELGNECNRVQSSLDQVIDGAANS